MYYIHDINLQYSVLFVKFFAPYLLAIEHKNAYAACSDKILSKVGRDTPIFLANADFVILPDR